MAPGEEWGGKKNLLNKCPPIEVPVAAASTATLGSSRDLSRPKGKEKKRTKQKRKKKHLRCLNSGSNFCREGTNEKKRRRWVFDEEEKRRKKKSSFRAQQFSSETAGNKFTD